MNKFSNLNASQSTSFSIKSIYENFNQISKYKLEKSPDLREKAKKFILEQIEEDKKVKIQAFSKTSKNNNNFLSIKYNMNLNNSKKTLSRLSSENYERSNISSKNIVNKTGLVKRATLQFDESKLEDKAVLVKSARKEEECISPRKGEKDDNKKSKRFFSVINKKRNSIKKRQGRRHELNREKEKTFYNQIVRNKSLKKKRTIEDKPEKEQKNNKMNYGKLISENIEKNQQNLNNPEEYFHGFFKNIISKRKQNNNGKSEEKLKRRSTVEY